MLGNRLSPRVKPDYLGGRSDTPVAPSVQSRIVELRRKLVGLADEMRDIEQQIAEEEMTGLLTDYAKTVRVLLRVNGDAGMVQTVLDSLTRSVLTALEMPLTAPEWCNALKRYTPADVDDIDGPMLQSFDRVMNPRRGVDPHDGDVIGSTVLFPAPARLPSAAPLTALPRTDVD